MKIPRLLNSLLKEIQEWWRFLNLQEKLYACGQELMVAYQAVRVSSVNKFLSH